MGIAASGDVIPGTRARSNMSGPFPVCEVAMSKLTYGLIALLLAAALGGAYWWWLQPPPQAPDVPAPLPTRIVRASEIKGNYQILRCR